MRSTNYIYASAKIRALEPKILDTTDIERMVDAPNLETAFKVLNDTDYADNILEVDPLDYREALRDDFQQLYHFLQKITPDQSLFDLILLERDFVNIRLFFKAKYFGVDVKDHIEENAVYPNSHLKDYIFETHIHAPELIQNTIEGMKNSGLDEEIREVIYQADKKFDENTKPDEIDSTLTQMYFDLMTEKAAETKSKFIKDFVGMQIDTANLLVWVRAKRLGLSKDKLKTKLIRGGHADINKLITLFPEEARGLKPFVHAHFDAKVNEEFDTFLENDELFELERALEDWKIKFARMSKNYAYGPEVIFGYFIAKQNAVANIRIILTGKMNNLPVEAIKRTLRETF